jgi:hypothetical protein
MSTEGQQAFVQLAIRTGEPFRPSFGSITAEVTARWSAGCTFGRGRTENSLKTSPELALTLSLSDACSNYFSFSRTGACSEATVLLQGGRGGKKQIPQLQTDEKGRFRRKGLKLGAYLITAVLPLDSNGHAADKETVAQNGQTVSL